MEQIKSRYQMKIEQLKKDGIIKFLTPEENKRVAEQFTVGFGKFRTAQARRNSAAQKALAKIRLNA